MVVNTHTSRYVKLPIFKGSLDDDPNTHIAQFEKIFLANHEQNDETNGAIPKFF